MELNYKLAMTMAWMAAAALCASANELTIMIFDYATVSRGDLSAASNEARYALNAAGVESAWSICQINHGPHCKLPPAGSYAEVKILPPSMNKALPKREALAFAFVCKASQRCTTSWVLYRPVVNLASESDEPVSLVLAYAMVHEIGHLMGLRHSETGIMKPAFDQRDLQDASQRRLRFEPMQAMALQRAVAVWTGMDRASSR